MLTSGSIVISGTNVIRWGRSGAIKGIARVCLGYKIAYGDGPNVQFFGIRPSQWGPKSEFASKLQCKKIGRRDRRPNPGGQSVAISD